MKKLNLLVQKNIELALAEDEKRGFVSRHLIVRTGVSTLEKLPEYNLETLIAKMAKMFRSMVFENQEKDAFGHAKLGGVGDMVSAKLKEISPKYNNGMQINTITQKLGYLVRGGDPDAIDSIVPMAYGNLALDLILKGVHEYTRSIYARLLQTVTRIIVVPLSLILMALGYFLGTLTAGLIAFAFSIFYLIRTA